MLLHGCASNEDGPYCYDYMGCVDGELKTERACCPEGVSCNYGQGGPGVGPRTCDDGSCVDPGELCPCETPDAGCNETCDADAGAEECGDAG